MNEWWLWAIQYQSVSELYHVFLCVCFGGFARGQKSPARLWCCKVEGCTGSSCLPVRKVVSGHLRSLCNHRETQLEVCNVHLQFPNLSSPIWLTDKTYSLADGTGRRAWSSRNVYSSCFMLAKFCFFCLFYTDRSTHPVKHSHSRSSLDLE